MTGVTTATAPCAHHWILASPDGPTAAAFCRKCGAERQFRHALDQDVTWSERADLRRGERPR